MMSIDKSKSLSIINVVLNERGIRKKGDNYAYNCKKCLEKKRNLEVNVKTQLFNCWVCGFKGRKIRNLLLSLKAPQHYVSEIDSIYGYAETNYYQNDDVEEIVTLPLEFRSLANHTNSIEYKQAMWYAKNRGITIEDIIKYNIGYCEEGEYKNRVVIPSYDSDGKLNFFSSRAYYDSCTLSYLNSETSKDIVGFELFVNWNEPIVICEGAFDAIAIKRNVIPLFGKIIPDNLLLKIIKNSVKEIFLVLDNDALKSTIEISENFLSEGKTVRVVLLKDKDPSIIGFDRITKILKETPELDFSSLMKMKMGL